METEKVFTEKLFRTGDGRTVTYSEMIKEIAEYIKHDTQRDYELTVGTDSQTGKRTKMSEVVVARRIGAGGIFFYRTEWMKAIKDLKVKIYEETSRSLENANGLLDYVKLTLMEDNIDIDDVSIGFIIHCDVGCVGSTKSLVKEIVGWVESCGYECEIKPDSYASSCVANKYSKFAKTSK